MSNFGVAACDVQEHASASRYMVFDRYKVPEYNANIEDLLDSTIKYPLNVIGNMDYVTEKEIETYQVTRKTLNSPEIGIFFGYGTDGHSQFITYLNRQSETYLGQGLSPFAQF